MNQPTQANNTGMTPILTTPAGCCLTTENWQEAGITVASFYLTSLLMKPGYDFLKTLPSLAAYVNWHECLVLNASLPTPNKDGLYVIRSHYDGSSTSFSSENILELIQILQPTMVILPSGLWKKHPQICESLPEKILPFLPVMDSPKHLEIKRPYGVYFSQDKKISSSSALLEQITQYKDVPCYIAGDLDLPLMIDLINHGAQFVESDRPASDACLGKIYSEEGEISIQDSAWTMQFDLLDAHCQCPTCNQQFTRAYLHHLLEHTPLLCQRLLVQHNIYFAQSILSKK